MGKSPSPCPLPSRERGFCADDGEIVVQVIVDDADIDRHQRFECGGYNIAGIVALGASLELLLNVGIDVIWKRLHALTTMLAEGVKAKGYRVYSPRDHERECSGIVSFSSPQPEKHADIVKALEAQHIIIVERENRLRAAPHFYQREEQIQTLMDALPSD